MMSYDACSSFREPCLVMVVEPETKTRFRYESEGGSHGGLTGKYKVNGKKTYPTVKLQNYSGPSKDIFIRVSLYTEEKKEHVLTFKKKSSGSQDYIDENLKEDFTAEFKNLTILSKKKEDVYQALMDRKFKMLGRNPSQNAKDLCERENSETVKKEAKEILNSVLLRFDAFERCRRDVQICPPLYSEPICNQKASCRGDLKIHRMSKVSGSWRGEEEVILLCDKVQKDNIKILFYEKDVEDGWKAYASFNPADVHYQVAIPFKTPNYKENIEKEVAVALERNGELSDPRPFTYIPDDYPSKKRKMDFSENILPVFCPNSNSAVSDDNIQEVPTNSLTSEEQESESSLTEDTNNLEFLAGFLADFEYDSNSLRDLFPDLLPDTDMEKSPDLFPDTDMEKSPYLLPDTDMEMSGDFCFPKVNIKTDVGNLVGQMAVMEIEDSKSVVDIPNPLDKKHPRSVRSSENQKEKLKKCLHLISKRSSCGNTLLHSAVIHNKSIETLIKLSERTNSGILNVQNCDGQTALHIAVEKNHGVVQNLLQSGCNPNLKNSDGNNCYHIACLMDCGRCMKDLLTFSKFSPGINEFNYDGLTPLHIAIKKKSTSCFDILMENCKIDLLTKEKNCDKSLLHYAVEYQPSFILPIQEKANIDVNIQDSEGNTPLHIACAASNYDTVKQLLLANANPLIRNFKQNYPDSEEESSSDETPDGQTPADLTKDSRILELLKQASEKNKSSLADSTNNSGNETVVTKLCSLLDCDGRWEQVALYILDDKHLGSLKFSSSPTRTLLEYMKKQSREKYIQNFKNILKMLCFNDALEMITESC